MKALLDLGRIEESRDSAGQAGEHFHEALESARQLFDNVNDSTSVRLLAASLACVATFYVRGEKYRRALEFSVESLNLARQQIARFGSSVSHLHELSDRLRAHGRVLTVCGGHEEAALIRGEALQICRKVLEEYGPTTERVELLVDCLIDIARGCFMRDKFAEANDCYHEAMSILGSAEKALGSAERFLSKTYMVQAGLGELFLKVENFADAETCCTGSIDTMRKLIGMDGSSAERRHQLSISLTNAAELSFRNERK